MQLMQLRKKEKKIQFQKMKLRDMKMMFKRAQMHM